ncbi:hypothetical protein HXP44_22845 [Streptomyces sioyaensis]|nr:hypothetical protein [Streptomyces sioyaensis]MBM4794823.1 hypothetical protein [Streptomyces sioyaensis]
MDILFCECDAVMTSHRATTPNKGSYRCRRRRVLPGQHEGDCTISQKTLDQFVARRICAIIQSAEDDPETADILAEATRRYAAQKEDPELAGERRSLLAERADARQALEELYDREEAGDYNDPVGRRRFRERKDRLMGVTERTEARLSELETAATPALPIHLWLAPGAPAVDPIGPGSWWDTAPVEDRRAFVKLFVERITITKAVGAGKSSPVETRTDIQFVRSPNAPDEQEAEQPGEAFEVTA